MLIDMLFELIDRGSALSVGMSIDTQPTPPPIYCNQQSLVYQLTVGGVLVDYRWYQSTVNHYFAEIAAVSLPIEDAEVFSLCSCVNRARMQVSVVLAECR